MCLIIADIARKSSKELVSRRIIIGLPLELLKRGEICSFEYNYKVLCLYAIPKPGVSLVKTWEINLALNWC